MDYKLALIIFRTSGQHDGHFFVVLQHLQTPGSSLTATQGLDANAAQGPAGKVGQNVFTMYIHMYVCM